MYGSSSKLGRPVPVGRGAGAKRPHSSFPLPPPHRPSGRPSIGGGAGGSATNPRHRASGATMSASPQSVEETFSLVSGNNPLAFAMIIRLTPHLVDEVKRVESQGGTARIKFDANANNSGGNVIDVGGTEFRFTWSRELGDLCDIYEERRSGEDGSGLLIESGSAWRKLNVQRVLDESTKNHVKKMSEEAERKSKARKAIVLEPGNPSMKSQIKALAAVEATPWRNYKQKKESPMKKQKTESSQVGGPPKSAYKPALLSVTAVKGRSSLSPLPSPPEQPAAPPSPLGASNISKTRTSVEDIKPLLKPKDNGLASSEKASLTRTNEPFRQTPGEKGNLGNKPTNLQSFLIALLMENPKGMSLKALEKSVGDKFPNVGKNIEPIIKNIATFQSPGRYYLKPGVVEGSKKPFESGSGNGRSSSSPEDSSHQATIRENVHAQTLVPEQCFEKESLNSETDHHARQKSKVRESSALEETEIQQNAPDRFGEKRGSEVNEGQAGSSSDSGSDSDSESDSSDSGSDSGSRSRSRSKSRSRSRSPAGSGSGSSSDSESDASSNSKEGSDEDVDIMTSDDDREPKNQLQASEPRFSTSPVPSRTPGAVILKSKNHEEDGGNEFDKLDLERHTPDGLPETDVFLVAENEDEKFVDKSSFSLDPGELQERQEFIGSLFDERVNPIHDSTRDEHFDGSEKVSGSKSKSGSDLEYLNENYHHTKRFKAGNFGEPSVSEGWNVGLLGSHSDSPSKLKKNSLKDPTNQLSHIDRVTNAEFGSQKEYKQPSLGKHQVQPADPKSFDKNGREKLPDTAEKPGKSVENSGRGRKNSNKGVSLKKDKSRTHSHKDEANRNEIKVPESLKEGGTGAKQSEPSNSYYQIQNEAGQMSMEADHMSSLIIGFSPKEKNRFGGDKSPIINGKGRVLQRELSDLELGELREPLSEAAPAEKKFERKSSFRQSENRGNTLDNRSSDFNKGKTIKKAASESGRLSPPHATTRIPYNLDSSNRKTNADDQSTDLTRPDQRPVHSQPQQTSRVDQSEVGHPFDKLADANVQSRRRDLPVSQGVGLEGCGESYRKSTMVTSQPDIERGPVFHSIKDSKRLASNPSIEVNDRLKDLVSVEVNNGDPKRRDSSSDENSSYSKYEKSEPEFKGPIKDFSQYKEYVQEYRDKYDSYCSLNKILESYRTKFEKLGRDLESTKGHDAERYSYLLEQLKDSYRKCGLRHKRLKKIFIVLHEELKHIKQRIKDFAVSY